MDEAKEALATVTAIRQQLQLQRLLLMVEYAAESEGVARPLTAAEQRTVREDRRMMMPGVWHMLGAYWKRKRRKDRDGTIDVG